MNADDGGSQYELVLMATLIGNYWVRSMRRTWEHFNGDLAMAFVLGEIAVYNVSQLHVSPEACRSLPQRLREGRLHELLKPCNAYSIAEATGMPRETVRRKFGLLEQQDWITRVPEGGFIVSTRCVDHAWRDTYPAAFHELMATVCLLRMHLPGHWFAAPDGLTTTATGHALRSNEGKNNKA